MSDFFSYFLVPMPQLLFVIGVIFATFIVFGITGFGTALIGAPLLAIYIPVAQVIPMLTLIDFLGAFINFIKNKKDVSVPELKRLSPLMIAGSIVGATLLLKLHPKLLVVLLGFFAIGYALYSFIKKESETKISPWFCIPFGFIGGIFSALFGSGGFIYMMYLSRRLKDKGKVRATLSIHLTCSTLIRSIIFLFAGLYATLAIVYTALLLIPFMIFGILIGRNIHLKISAYQYRLIVNLLIMGSGITLLLHHFL
ncbi:sulfite exporter TauE/SafE family protein [bacterium]|nr:sulfite exporter TauE/SafE family protein [bacterium]